MKKQSWLFLTILIIVSCVSHKSIETGKEKKNEQKKQNVIPESTKAEQSPYKKEVIIPFLNLTEKPHLIHKVAPIYPDSAKQQATEGTVILKVLIDTHGNVEKVEILRSIPVFDEAAIIAVKQFKFKPGKQSNRDVKTWISIPFNFKLQ